MSVDFAAAGDWLKAEAMCYKCVAGAAIATFALYYTGTISASTADPMSFAKPFGIIFASGIAADAVWAIKDRK